MFSSKYIFVFIFSTGYFQSICATSDLDRLKRENFQIGISNVGASLSNSASDTQCGKELQIFLKSVQEKELWALKLIDSFGVKPMSFHWGNYYWYSTKEFCEDLNEPIKITLSDRYGHTNSFNTSSPFAVRFWMIYFNFTSPVYVDLKLEYKNHIHVGLCLPQSCSQDQAVLFSQTYFSEQSFELQQIFDIKMDVASSKTPEFKWTYFLKPGILISFLYLVLSTALMVIAQRIHTKKSPTDSFTRLEQFVLCFHLKDNYHKTLGDENSNRFISAIVGLRAIACVWITLAHVLYFSFVAINNVLLMVAKTEYFILQPLITSVFYEDVFFVLSSFLLVYNFLSHMELIEAIKVNSLKANVLLFFRRILTRYMRFLPILLATLLAVNNLYDLLDMYSPLKMDEFSPVYCKENWWYNILYINNFLDFRQMCCTWNWFLACEMQLFIIFTGLLFILVKNESLGKSLFTGLLVAGVAICFILHYYFESTFQLDVVFGTGKELYTKPWNRINSYTGGALVAWLFFKTKEHPIKVSRVWKLAFWTFCYFLWVATSYMSYWRTMPLWLMASIMSFGKLVFALCIGGVIVMCEWGHGGPVNSILSSRLFLLVNNLSYAIYMVTPVIIVAIYGLQPEVMQLNVISAIMDVIGASIFTIVISFGLVLIVELPAEKLRSKFTERKRPTSTQININSSETNGQINKKQN